MKGRGSSSLCVALLGLVAAASGRARAMVEGGGKSEGRAAGGQQLDGRGREKTREAKAAAGGRLQREFGGQLVTGARRCLK